MFIQNLILLLAKIAVLIQKCIVCIRFKICHRKTTIVFGHNMVTAATQPEHTTILSSPFQKHESNPKLKDNEDCCLAIVVTSSNVDSHIYMLLLSVWFQDKARCVRPSRMDMEQGKTKARSIMVKSRGSPRVTRTSAP
jgi:hypothetical protein